MGKYRQLQAQLDGKLLVQRSWHIHNVSDAEERADVAENSLSKLRAKNRSSASIAPAGGLATSASAAVIRSSSRNFDF